MEKDYAKEANQLHIAFHRDFLDAEKDEKAIAQVHSLFDTLVLWIEKMQKEIYRLQGALEEARRERDRLVEKSKE
ncbi:hypothetical protein ES706_03753 [subsurface metagenome]